MTGSSHEGRVGATRYLYIYLRHSPTRYLPCYDSLNLIQVWLVLLAKVGCCE